MGPVIVRTAAPECCVWCAKLSGVYDYNEVRDTGNDVFRRHERCRCTVTYRDNGTVQDVWSKKIYGADEKTLEQRAAYGLDTQKATPEEMPAARPKQDEPNEANIAKKPLQVFLTVAQKVF